MCVCVLVFSKASNGEHGWFLFQEEMVKEAVSAALSAKAMVLALFIWWEWPSSSYIARKILTHFPRCKTNVEVLP